MGEAQPLNTQVRGCIHQQIEMLGAQAEQSRHLMDRRAATIGDGPPECQAFTDKWLATGSGVPGIPAQGMRVLSVQMSNAEQGVTSILLYKNKHGSR